MKILRLFGYALTALLMTSNLTSCNEVITPEEPQEDKYLEVSLACAGEILEVETSPLTKPGGNEIIDMYSIVVYSLKEYTGTRAAGEDNYQEIPYAYGYFANSLEGVSIKLLQGSLYRFKVKIINDTQYYELGTIMTDFVYSGTYAGLSIPYTNEGFYGELDKYAPEDGGLVTINTKRVSYGAEFIAQDLAEGTIDVKVSKDGGMMPLYSVALTPDSPSHYKIYSFSDPYTAWRGKEVWNDMMITGYENYSTEKQLEINWIKNGETYPLGKYNVTFERNMKTTVKIKAEENSASKGISVVVDQSEINGNRVFEIQGGKVTEVPVNNG